MFFPVFILLLLFFFLIVFRDRNRNFKQNSQAKKKYWIFFSQLLLFDSRSTNKFYNFFFFDVVHEMIYAVTRNWLAAKLHQTILCIQKTFVLLLLLRLLLAVLDGCERARFVVCHNYIATRIVLLYFILRFTQKSHKWIVIYLLNGTNQYSATLLQRRCCLLQTSQLYRNHTHTHNRTRSTY